MITTRGKNQEKGELVPEDVLMVAREEPVAVSLDYCLSKVLFSDEDGLKREGSTEGLLAELKPRARTCDTCVLFRSPY